MLEALILSAVLHLSGNYAQPSAPPPWCAERRPFRLRQWERRVVCESANTILAPAVLLPVQANYGGYLPGLPADPEHLVHQLLR